MACDMQPMICFVYGMAVALLHLRFRVLRGLKGSSKSHHVSSEQLWAASSASFVKLMCLKVLDLCPGSLVANFFWLV
jgi:hypothetical protein